ncbi:MAG TPA: hypothetical protein VIG51_13030 [Candidatus Baltobacteraceae bacterium]
MIALSDDTGIIQHAIEDIPNRPTGYCIDDVSRAYIVALQKLELDAHNVAAKRLASTYLSFMHDAQLEDGRFHNFMSYDRTWLDAVGTHDSVGRTIWALGFGMRFAPRATWRKVSKRLLDRSIQALEWLSFTHSRAYAILGLAYAVAADDLNEADIARYKRGLRYLADGLKSLYVEGRGAGWEWFEQEMTYDNARMPEAMLRAGLALRDDELIAIGLRTLAFYEETTIEHGIYVPIGNDGWYKRGGHRARYAQQPLEAVALVDAALAAYDASGEPCHRSTAQVGLEWFYGRNSRGLVMARGGGCLDGLGEHGVNQNMGAESTLAYLSAAYALAAQPAKALSVAR